MQTRRERVKQMAYDEISALSWEIIGKSGIKALTVNGIARKMGMTPPAFYRYYKSRDELIKSLVIEAYRSFRKYLEAARDSVSEENPARRIYMVSMAYRQWAVDNANMFNLFAGRPAEKIDLTEMEIFAEARENVLLFTGLYSAAWKKGLIKKPAMKLKMPQSYSHKMMENIKNEAIELPVEVTDLLNSGICMLHGMISMELTGRLPYLAGDPEQFYAYQVLVLMQRFGMEYQPDKSR